MIADWTVDVGPDAPWIEAPWAGWVDLLWDEENALQSMTARPWRADLAATLPEAQSYPELIELLRCANASDRCTAKVDVFAVDAEEVDPEIAEAGLATGFGLGCYIDLLTTRLDVFRSFEHFEGLAKLAVANLGKIETPRNCCAEIVVRPALWFGASTYAWTIYAMGFGPSEEQARDAWATAALVVVRQVNLDLARMLDGRAV